MLEKLRPVGKPLPPALSIKSTMSASDIVPDRFVPHVLRHVPRFPSVGVLRFR
jgi:hypothetical protein